MDVRRRDFLRARPGASASPPRPPWSLPEAEFTDRCTRCGDCVEACPTGLLTTGTGRFPIADFSAGATCDFCGRCADSCRAGALRRHDAKPWDLQAAIGDACLARHGVICRTCGEACEARAIAFPPKHGGVAEPQLDADCCSGCGDCLGACPTQAIAMRTAVERPAPPPTRARDVLAAPTAHPEICS